MQHLLRASDDSARFLLRAKGSSRNASIVNRSRLHGYGDAMRSRLVNGALAGAAGTCALNLFAYLDMAATRRSSSAVPRLAAHAIAARAGLAPRPIDDEASMSRWEGFGEALGYVHGVCQGIGYGFVRARLRESAWRVGAVALCLETFVVGEGACIALGATDPRTWGLQGYARGLLLRLAFGIVTAAAFDALSES